MSQIDERVGEAVWSARVEAAVTLDDLAAMIGMPPGELLRCESGARRLSAGELRSVSVALDIPLAKLFCGFSPQTGASPTS